MTSTERQDAERPGSPTPAQSEGPIHFHQPPSQTLSSSKPLRIFISTGEVSGDLQGSLLIEAIRRQFSIQCSGETLEIVALGGDRMAKAGATLLGNTSHISSIGLVESLPYVLPTLFVQQRALRYLKANPPDLVVLIDYIGPNLTISRYFQKHMPDVPVAYYIAPQEWVWSLGKRNTRQIVGLCDRILAIFPEEARYYSRAGAPVTYVGHPLLDRMQTAPTQAEARQQLGISLASPLQDPDASWQVTLMPASRRQEIKYLLPVMFESARRIQAQVPNIHFWIPLSLEIYRPALEAAIKTYGLKATLVTDKAPLVMAAADLAITKSGTANLELALLNVPQVVLYRVHPLTAWIAEHILKFSIPFMSPPNLVQMEPIVPEFLQYQATPEAVTEAAMGLLLDADRRRAMLSGYARMRATLGEPGVCDRAANELLTLVKGKRFE